MKKVLLFLLAVILMLAASCRENEVSPDEVTGGHRMNGVFYSSIDESFDAEDSTKTSLNVNLQLSWNSNDEVSIFDGTTGNLKYVFSGADGDRDGSLVFNSGDALGTSLSKVYAFYPYGENVSISATGVISAIHPREQTFAVGSFGRGANMMAAIADIGSMDLHFRNACGYLRLSLTGSSNITAIQLKGNNNEKISGTMEITPSEGGITVTPGIEATGELLLNLGEEGIPLTSAPTLFYIALPPTSFSAGITVKIFGADGKIMTKSSSQLLTVARNHIVPMNSFAYYPSGDELPFMQQTALGVYALDGTPVYTYTKGKDQIAVETSLTDVDFKLLNNVDNKLVSLEQLPLNVITGDEFSSRIYSYHAVGVPSHTTVNVVTLRKKGDTLYLLDGTNSLCYIVKNE